jgi:protein-tyrosine phosphatase
MKKVLIVCLGNICRSPTAEAVLKARAKKLGVNVKVDSAGTIGYHEVFIHVKCVQATLLSLI